MDSRELGLRVRAAQAIVREAGQQAAEAYRHRDQLSVERKSLQDLVSEADRSCEDTVVGALHSLFPEDSFLGEERGIQHPGGRAMWIIDPIDGTSNFLSGIPVWCVSAGLVEGMQATAGIIYNPVTDELYSAHKGGGATLNGKRIQVSSTRALEEARIGVGFSYRRPVEPHASAIKALLDARCEYIRLGSGALGMAMTADGRLDGYWEAHINIWDVAAGLCLVQEAGGCTNEFMKPDVFDNGNSILATTSALKVELELLLCS